MIYFSNCAQVNVPRTFSLGEVNRVVNSITKFYENESGCCGSCGVSFRSCHSHHFHEWAKIEIY